MDGLYPSNSCNKFTVSCNNTFLDSKTGGTWASTAFIRNRGQPSFATLAYDAGYQDYFTNNPAPSPVYVRVAPSQYDGNKLVYWINGWETPRLILTVGNKYQFNVNTCGYPFYLTNDSKGGNGNNKPISSVPPADFYVTTYSPTESDCGEHWYQCSTKQGMGGKIIIKGRS